MSYYECKRCLSTFKQKIDIKRHVSRKNKCTKAPQGCDYSKEEWIEKSLQIVKYIPIPLSKTNSLNYSTNSTLSTNLPNKSVILNNPHETNSVIKNEECQEFRCSTCFKIFSRKYNLQRHHCKIKEKLYNSSILSLNRSSNNKCYLILPFDISWDDSHILHYYREKIINSLSPFTNLLCYLLMNPNNLNCLMDNNTTTCILFQEKKDNELLNVIQQTSSFSSFKLHTHNKQDIIPIIFKKLHSLLQHYLDSLLKTFNEKKENFAKIKKQEITEKYTKYFQNQDIRQHVSQNIIDIYQSKKEETLFYFNKVQEILTSKSFDGY